MKTLRERLGLFRLARAIEDGIAWRERLMAELRREIEERGDLYFVPLLEIERNRIVEDRAELAELLAELRATQSRTLSLGDKLPSEGRS